MASKKGGGSGLSSKESCSICLEPFRGRDPKILPCFHTYCLECLSRLAEKARMDMAERRRKVWGRPSTEEETEEDVVIICPTCREDVTVPSEGVHKFQSNFYLEEVKQSHVQPILCDMCDQARVASHCCSRCQLKLCFHCHHGHGDCPQAGAAAKAPAPSPSEEEEKTQLWESVTAQRELVWRLLSQAEEEEKELHEQKTAVEGRVHEKYAAGLACLSDARDDVLRKITAHAQQREEKLQSETADMQKKSEALARFSSQRDGGSLTAADLRAALLPESELRRLRTPAEEKTVEFFSLKTGGRQAAAVLVSDLSELVFGSLELRPATRGGVLRPADIGGGDAVDAVLLSGESAPQASCQQQLQHRGSAEEGKLLSSRVDDLGQKLQLTLKKVRENESQEKRLQVEMRSVLEEVKSMRDKNDLLMQGVAAAQAENAALREDVTRLQSGQGSRSPDSAGLQGASNTTPSVQKAKGIEQPTAASSKAGTSSETAQRIQQLQSDVVALKGMAVTDRQSIQNLGSAIGKAAQPIYFKAELDRKVTTNSERPLICKEVVASRGGGYDNQSGRFLAPVSGTYLFLVTVAPCHDNKMAELNICQGDFDCEYEGYVCSESLNCSSSGNCILRLEEGDSVWLRTFPRPASFDKDGMTSFSGMLLKPDLGWHYEEDDDEYN